MPQGKGSSRVCFQLSDDKILKLAFNQKGAAQNMNEFDHYLDDIGVIPHIYDMDDNGLWVISEYVLPAKKQDFKQSLNLSFDEFIKWVKSDWFYHFGSAEKRHLYGELYDKKETNEMYDNNEYLIPFDDYISNYEPPLGDLMRIVNYGMTMRNGHPTIVLLDAGLSQEVWNTYYKK